MHYCRWDETYPDILELFILAESMLVGVVRGEELFDAAGFMCQTYSYRADNTFKTHLLVIWVKFSFL